MRWMGVSGTEPELANREGRDFARPYGPHAQSMAASPGQGPSSVLAGVAPRFGHRRLPLPGVRCCNSAALAGPSGVDERSAVFLGCRRVTSA